ncbi:EcsC family protein [Castellaniella sp. GW247-6E4]|uniref:EcsC family protein n=1 Tax=Castellaniella sp. GW247-6E4 TaxID=3140380 RepID=UPI003315097D
MGTDMSSARPLSPLSAADLEDLRLARRLLENPGLTARMTNALGAPIERGLRALPKDWNARIDAIARAALTRAADAALFTLKDRPGEASSRIWHKFGAAASGGVGGFFGLAALTIELPVSTTVMLRSIADIARAEGESISSAGTRVACLEVFALGGRSGSDDGAESGYFAVRAALAKSVTDATQFLAAHHVAAEGAPVMVQLITRIAKRFGADVTSKAAAQAVPAIGAIGGAAINLAFINHFQDMARGHFIIRRLERAYGAETIKRAYEERP